MFLIIHEDYSINSSVCLLMNIHLGCFVSLENVVESILPYISKNFLI